jgi:glycosyltransferase involved in cell wall biosynthesis
MKIAVNLLPFREKIAGAGKYAVKIIQELSMIDSQNDYYLFVTERGRENFNISKANFHFIAEKFNPNFFVIRILWEQLIFPFKLKKLNPDIIFTPSVAVPLIFRGKFLTTIHDLAYKNNLQKYPFLRKIYINVITRIAVKKSIIIFTVSNFSKREIENEFALKDKKVLITYNGVDDSFFRDYKVEEIIKFRKKYNLPDIFILYVGAIEPGKNLDKLFIAFSELLKKYDLELNLVLTTGVGWKQDYIINLLDQLKIKDKIIFLPYIEESELPLLYKSSKMLAYLSDYEGFGIPVLEALATGTPVLTSTSEAIMEYSGNVVTSVNSQNIEEIVKGIYDIITNKDFVSAKIIEGRKEAEKFKWVSSAKIIYNQISSFSDE